MGPKSEFRGIDLIEGNVNLQVQENTEKVAKQGRTK